MTPRTCTGYTSRRAGPHCGVRTLETERLGPSQPTKTAIRRRQCTADCRSPRRSAAGSVRQTSPPPARFRYNSALEHHDHGWRSGVPVSGDRVSKCQFARMTVCLDPIPIARSDYIYIIIIRGGSGDHDDTLCNRRDTV